MATTAKTTIKVACTGDGNASEWSVDVTNNYGPAGGPVNVTLAASDNAFVVPTGSMGVILIPRASSPLVMKLKATGTDAGFALRGGKPSYVALPTGATGMLLNASMVDLIGVHWT